MYGSDPSVLPHHPDKIIATLLSGNSQPIVAAAVESVIDWVDELCLIDTGISDGTREQVAAIAGAKLWVASFPWCDDFAAARNQALRVATERGAGWALTIDADERLHFANYRHLDQLRQALGSASDIQAWTVAVRNGSYDKERFIRLPTALQWQGRTHEALTSQRSYHRRKLKGCHFSELGKSPAEQQQKLQRDLHILLDETRAQPLNARWWYYLGQTYEALRQFRKAVMAFDHCIRLDGWPDESAWACYTAARCLVALKEYRQAEEYCCLGLSRKPSLPELPWLAGWCCFQRGALPEAVTWCKVAIVLGRDTQPDHAGMFRHVPAWYEAPYDVLRHVFQLMGKRQDAETAEQDFQTAKAHRLSLFPASG